MKFSFKSESQLARCMCRRINLLQRHAHLSVCIALMLLAFIPATSGAQAFYGSVLGLVTDSTGAAIPNAEVTLRNVETAGIRVAKSNANGEYQFVNLVPGNYQLDVVAKGFKHFTRTSIDVQVASAVRINASMPVGAQSEVIEVTSASPLIDTEGSSEGQVVEGRTVQDTPLNGRNVMNLLTIAPGVVAQGSTAGAAQGNQNGGGHTNNSAWGNYQIGGGTAGQSAQFLDGVPLNVLGTNTVALIPTQDAVQEFQVEINDVSPQFGRFAGGVVTMTTKTGTNRFHGSLYEYLRNTVFDANNYFSNQTGQARPALHQNQYGLTLGGPIKKDKLFFFFSWDRFKFDEGYPFVTNVPTLAQRMGDFSAELGAPTGVMNACTGQPVLAGQIFNPYSTQTVNGQVCRTPFPGNMIPSTSFDTTGNYILNTADFWPAPNTSSPEGNYSSTTPVGGKQQQFNARGDYNISSKQQMFARYTYWGLSDLSQNVFSNQTGNPPSDNRTQQAVVGDTFTFNPRSILDVRGSFTRDYYDNAAISRGTNLSPYGPAWGSLQQQASFSEVPSILLGPPLVPPEDDDFLMNFQDVTSFQWDNSYVITANVIKLIGKHTLNFGADVRRLESNTTGESTDPTGQYEFLGTFTSYNNNLPSTGNTVADLLLGTPESGSLTTVKSVAQYEYYQGYYATDTWQATRKLTANFGVRWEIPGAYEERHDNATVLLQNASDPLGTSVGLSLKGQLALVNSSLYRGSSTLQEHYHLFAPRVGLNYMLNSKTIVRTGYGISFPPSDLFTGAAPTSSPINSAITSMVTSTNGGLTPYNTLSSPFPANGTPGNTTQSVNQPAGRSQPYLTTLEGQTIISPVPAQPYPYVQQYNINIERQIGDRASGEIAYLGSKGTHLPLDSSTSVGGLGLDQLPDQYDSMGSALLTSVANPFAGNVSSMGSLDGTTVPAGQLLRPYPQFVNVVNSTPFYGASSYNSLQVKGQVRFGGGGTLIASYTFSKIMTNTDTLNGFLESGTVGTPQDFTNLKADRSISSFNVPNRFVVSYVLDLPVGRGKRFLRNANEVTERLVGGWGVDGITTLQSGFPLVITAQPNSLSNYFGAGTIRPNVVAGCAKHVSGSSQEKAASTWFNTNCFTQPVDFTFGNESRVDPTLSASGIANWDFAIFKKTKIRDGIDFQFRAEFFNLFNRVQFGVPGTQVGGQGFGTIDAQENSPRVMQLAGRLTF